MPGMLKMFSTMKEPTMVEAIMEPETVTTGMMALRTPCFQMISRWERPLAFAVLM